MTMVSELVFGASGLILWVSGLVFWVSELILLVSGRADGRAGRIPERDISSLRDMG